jgi:hypothetical protein
MCQWKQAVPAEQFKEKPGIGPLQAGGGDSFQDSKQELLFLGGFGSLHSNTKIVFLRNYQYLFCTRVTSPL